MLLSNFEFRENWHSGSHSLFQVIHEFLPMFRMVVPCIWFEIRVNYQLDANICLF